MAIDIFDNIFPLIGRIIRGIPVERMLFPDRDSQEELKKYLQAEQDRQPKALPERGRPATATKAAEKTPAPQEIAIACVPCALGHFSRSAGALEEAMRLKDQGIDSNEILDRVGSVLKEQNALERFDLTPEKIRELPQWERTLAEEALVESRRLRHKLEKLESIEQLEEAAAEAAAFYTKLNRAWFKERFAHLGERGDVLADNISGEPT